METIRIHHFFDIIRDYGQNSHFKPNREYGHSLHIIAEKIINDAVMPMKIVVGADSVCRGCIHLAQGKCNDVIEKPGFTTKDGYNNYIDNKILDFCGIREDNVYTPRELCALSKEYLDNIFDIYHLNDKEHTEKRKENAIKGLSQYTRQHRLKFNY